uniref:Si:dkey-39a18.1 n=1 Tax=Astyanax mexicanus TaxID=7994 RepID=A0A3B1JJ57_ASTMX
MRRSQSPSREVSPVPSYYSEPISVRQRNDVTLRLPPLLRWAHQEEEDDSEDTQSLKSLPTVMSTLVFDPKVKRSHHLSKEQVISGLNLPPLVTSKCTLVVKGTGCSKPRGFLPVIKSKSLDRPPCRAGCRYNTLYNGPDKLKASVGQSCQMLPSTIAVSEEPPGPRITFHSPVVNAEYSVTPDITKETWQTFRTHQSRRPVMKKAQRYFPCPREPHLLEPLSGFQEHLRHHPAHLLINQRDYPHHGLHWSRMERTVELCNSQEKRLPRITMTCPTPSPKHLQHPGKRHVA